MKFIARLLLASLGILFMMPSFLSASSDVRVSVPESAGCFTGIRCEIETTGTLVCFRDSTSIQTDVNRLVTSLTASNDRLDMHLVGSSASIHAGRYIGKTSVGKHLSQSFALKYVGIIKIQV